MAILNAGNPRVAIGLHVTLTAPFGPLSEDFRPLRDGAFLPLEATLRHSMLRRINRKRVAAEVASQLKAFVAAFGRAPDFIDGHQHVHLFPQVREAVLRVVKEVAPHAWVRQCGRAVPLRAAALRPQGAHSRRAEQGPAPARAGARRAHQSGLRRRL